MGDRQDKLATKNDLLQMEHKLAAGIDANGVKIAANAKKIDEVEKRLTEKIEENGAKIAANGERIAANAEKIDEVEKRLTEKIEANSAKIDANRAKIEVNGAKIEANSRKIDNLTVQVLENRERIEKMVTREEFNRRMDEVMNSLDALMRVFPRLDEERVVTNARIDQIESDVKKNKAEIEKIKTKLALP